MLRRFLFLLLVVGSLLNNANAQTGTTTANHFKTTIEIPHSLVKDQGSSGTCWSFSGVSFLESEMQRKTGKMVELSEMMVVVNCYKAKVQQYIRMRQAYKFTNGGEAHDVLWAVGKYGIVPREDYGNSVAFAEKTETYGEKLRIYARQVSANSDDETKRVTPSWEEHVDSLTIAVLGEDVPEEINYENKTYTPLEFAAEVVKFNKEDYVALTSYTHHPFYTSFVLEVPDNWLMEPMYNVTIDELEQVADEALQKGYSFVWGGDVSEKGFIYGNGVLVVADVEELGVNVSASELYSESGEEANISQEVRQKAFDDYRTTDDHGMHVVGLAKDKNGKVFYKVKNSWGRYAANFGYVYISKAYFRYKTMDIMVHKDALPKALRKKLGI